MSTPRSVWFDDVLNAAGTGPVVVALPYAGAAGRALMMPRAISATRSESRPRRNTARRIATAISPAASRSANPQVRPRV